MLLKLLQEIDKGDFEVSVVSLSGRGAMADRFEAVGIPVFVCDMKPGRFSIPGIFRLIKYIYKIRPDIVQSWLYHADLLGGGVARILGFRHIVWNIRNNNLDKDKNKAGTLFVARIAANLSNWIPQKIICNSINSAHIHQKYGFRGDIFAIIPNGFDLEHFRPNSLARESVRTELKLPASCQLVGLVARFDSQKNHKGFFDAARMLVHRVPEVYFMLVGTGINWENKDLVAFIGSQELTDSVRLLGQRDDIPRLTAALDVAVSASWGEGFPNTIGEAMACEVPCVVTDVGDCAEIVGETGWVAAPGDAAALSHGMYAALTLPGPERARIGSMARARIADRYAIATVVDQYESLYRSLSDGRGG